MALTWGKMEWGKVDLTSWLSTCDGCVAILYGSSLTAFANPDLPELNNFHDIDLCVIQPEGEIFQRLSFGRLDIVSFSLDFAESLLPVHEPALTEPLLTGKVIAGDLTIQQDLAKQLHEKVHAERAFFYLLSRAHEQTVEALRLWVQFSEPHKADNSDLRLVKRALAWAVSYASFANHFLQNGAVPVTFSELRRRQALLLPDFWLWYEKTKQKIDYDDDLILIKQWITAWANPARLIIKPKEGGVGKEETNHRVAEASRAVEERYRGGPK